MNDDYHEVFWSHGVKHSIYIDTSNNDDYSVETIMAQNKDGTFTILSCNLLPKNKKEDNTDI